MFMIISHHYPLTPYQNLMFLIVSCFNFCNFATLNLRQILWHLLRQKI